MQLEIKYFIIMLSVVLIFGGLYFKFMYDVPDGEEVTNMWVSWFLILFGIIGILASILWKKRDPLNITETEEDEKYVDLDLKYYLSTHMQQKDNYDDVDKSDSHDTGDLKK